MNAASGLFRRVLRAKGVAARRWPSRAAWIPLVAALVLALGWVVIALTGHRSLVVLTGSMEPALSPGDIIVVDVITPADARPLDVVTFRDPSRSDELVTHRVVAMRRVGERMSFLTKGDKNTGTEQWDVAPDGTIGRLSFRIPALGRIIIWLGRPFVRALLLGAAFVVLGAMAMRFAWLLRKPATSPVAVAGVTLLALLAGVVTIPGTLSAFSSADSNQGNVFSAGSTFGCTSPGIRAATATQDAWVGQTTPGTNYGSSTTLYARSDGANNKRTLVSFDLPAPGGCYVTGAWLGLYASTSQGTRTIEARRIAAPWSEGAVTWTDQPATTGTPATNINEAGWNYWDVTAMVQSMYSGSNYGFLVKDSAEGSATPSEQIYNSREQGSLRPTLYVSMAVNPTCVFPYGSVTGSGNATRDAWIAQDAPGQTNGGGPDLYVRSDASGANARTLVTFTLPTVPAGCALFASTLRLYTKSSTGTRTLEAWRLAGSWTENQVKWSTQPPMAGAPATTSSGLGWRSWDVTQIVQAMYAGTNNGFLVKDATESEGSSTQIFSSRQDSDNQPQLYVRWG